MGKGKAGLELHEVWRHSSLSQDGKAHIKKPLLLNPELLDFGFYGSATSCFKAVSHEVFWVSHPLSSPQCPIRKFRTERATPRLQECS